MRKCWKEKIEEKESMSGKKSYKKRGVQQENVKKIVGVEGLVEEWKKEVEEAIRVEELGSFGE